MEVIDLLLRVYLPISLIVLDAIALVCLLRGLINGEVARAPTAPLPEPKPCSTQLDNDKGEPAVCARKAEDDCSSCHCAVHCWELCSLTSCRATTRLAKERGR